MLGSHGQGRRRARKRVTVFGTTAAAVAVAVLTAVTGVGGTPAAQAAPQIAPSGVAAAAAVPVGSRQVFLGNYDTGNFAQWSTCQWRGFNGDCKDWKPTGNYIAQVLADGTSHPTAARFEVRNGDIPPFGGGERAEVRAGTSSGADVYEGDERWYQFSLKFDQGFRNPTGTFYVAMQWHAGDGSPPLALEISRLGVLQFANNRTGKRTDIAPIQRGVWVDYVVHAKFSKGSSAYAEAWVNGMKTPFVHRYPNMASTKNYLKMGVYRDAAETATAIVWQDGLRVTAP